MPVPPVFLRKGTQLQVLDGCHRVAALLHVQASGGRTEPEHEIWVADGPADDW